MKKILHIINGEFFAGAERVQDLLALRLPDFGYECGFVCLKNGTFKKHRRSEVPLYFIPMNSKIDISIVNRIAEIARNNNYSAIHTHTARSALIGLFVARKLKLPFVHHVHSPAGRDTESGIKNSINSILENYLIFPFCSCLVAVSSSLKKYLLLQGVSESKIFVVPNGVPIVRENVSWHVPESRWVIGVVALFRPRKGIEILLSALHKLIDAGENVCLRCIGSFETLDYERKIKKLVIDLNIQDKVCWTGFTSDVHSEMEKMDIFVLPSLFGEGLPMVVIEAMSVGVPIVASNVEGIPEVICSADYGFVVEPNDVDALQNGISKMISQAANIPKIVSSAHMRQREQFSDISMAKGLAEIYDKIIK